jgi:hypothetical protein
MYKGYKIATYASKTPPSVMRRDALEALLPIVYFIPIEADITIF